MDALILAGRRDGVVDPLADAYGVKDKCLVPLHGEALILHVIKALNASSCVERIFISINDSHAILDIPVVRDLALSGKIICVQAQQNLADSVIEAAQRAEFPLIITTGDNVLITSDAIADVMHQATTLNAQAAVAFARKNDVLAAHSDGQRRFYTFADDAYSNCNTYWIASAKSLSAVGIFRGGGQFAKHPLRIINAFGLMNLIRFKFGIGTLNAAFERFSKRFNLRILPVILNDGAIAIDVDNARTHKIASDIMARHDVPRGLV